MIDNGHPTRLGLRGSEPYKGETIGTALVERTIPVGAGTTVITVESVVYSMGYTMQEQVDGEFDTVVKETVTALEDEGFGVLCDIDVQATFAKKT